MAVGNAHHWLMLLVFVLLSVLQVVHASWWYLGVASSSQIFIGDQIQKQQPKEFCANLNFLHPSQRKICRDDARALEVISDGASMGINECQYQFRYRRWNCTTYDNDTTVFGPVMKQKIRETAYIYAITSAGIMYSVTRACAKAELVKCGCDTKVHRRHVADDFEWGGCSDNVRYGARFSKRFLDSSEPKTKDSGSMNLWNNGAGRKTIKTEVDLRCKCHGVSGDCSVKICWRKMHSFRDIGKALKNKFDGASRVTWDKKRERLKRRSGKHKRPTKSDLVYLTESPNFCEMDQKSGSLGTKGRQCNKTSIGLEGCNLMCCGRGYQTLVSEEKYRCDCKFHWCCIVECKNCTKVIEKHFCN